MDGWLKEKLFDAKSSPDKVLQYFMKVACKSGKYVFRGYNKDEEMYPQIIRLDSGQHIGDEIRLLHEFERYGASYLRVYNVVDFLACAQHYGLPTRLVDFTYNPYVALAFALQSEKEINEGEYYNVIYYRPEDIIFTNDNIMGEVTSASIDRKRYVTFSEQAEVLIKNLEQKFDTGRHHNITSRKGKLVGENIPVDTEEGYEKAFIFVDPFQSNPRLIVQQGLFMVPMSLNKETYETNIKREMKIVKIHKNLRSSLRSMLEVFGCDMYHLMPDLASICKNVRVDVLNKKSEKVDYVKGKV